MLSKDKDEIYRVHEWSQFPWLIHGFGTRSADVPSLFSELATLKQVHSAACVFADGRTGQLGQGDGLLENAPGSVVGIKTADCLPILLVDEQHRAIAAVHAGWRGTVAGIARHATDAMRERFGTRPENLRAAFGPAIGECCYEVGPEVSCHFGKQGRAHVNLAAANRDQLLDSGVLPERIYEAGLCTMCMPDEFHSYRRDREASGRLYSFIGIREG